MRGTGADCLSRWYSDLSVASIFVAEERVYSTYPVRRTAIGVLYGLQTVRPSRAGFSATKATLNLARVTAT
jgi:hypothetical protein